jgi:TctA family transporter
MLEQILSKNQTKLLIRAFSRHGETTHGSRLYSPPRVLLGSVLPSQAGVADGGVAEIAAEIAGERERGTLERKQEWVDTEPNGLARVEALTSGSAREWIVARFGARVDRTSGRRL